MPIKRNNIIHPWLYHGGLIELNTLVKQVLKLDITFPHTQNNGGWDCSPVTVNLLTDIGVSSGNNVYLVNWDNVDANTTISNRMNPIDHKHTFDIGRRQASFKKSFNIVLYGDPLLTHNGFVKVVGADTTGYKVVVTQVSLDYPVSYSRSSKRLDTSIPLGARISRAFFGENIVYGKSVAGSRLELDIRLNGNATVQLVNPLVSDNNDWNGKKTDIVVDWGDGSFTRYYNRKINTGLFNTDSKYLLTHTYTGNSGDTYKIVVNSVEPLLPIDCDLLSINGSLPQDKYDGNINGLLTYDANQISDRSYRSKLQLHKNTVTYVAPTVCDNWVQTEHLNNTFKGWKKLNNIEAGFFKSNILSTCKSYINTFSDNPMLVNVDQSLLGTTNDIVESIYGTFMNSSVNTVLNLESASKLTTISYIYNNTKVTTANRFLLSAPSLLLSNSAFKDSMLASHNERMMNDSLLLEDTSEMFKNSKMNRMIIDYKKYSHLYNLFNMYDNCPLYEIKDNLFGGKFANDVSNGKLNIDQIFARVGTDNKHTIVNSKVFVDLVNKRDKLKDVVDGVFAGAKIDSIKPNMFENVFKSDTPRFIISDLFDGVTTNDNMQYGRDYINIPRVFNGCDGVVGSSGLFRNTKIGFVDIKVFKDMPNTEDVSSMFENSVIHSRILDRLLDHNYKIGSYKNYLRNAEIVFNDIPLDRIISSNVKTINVSEMLNTRNEIKVYRMFGHKSKVATVTATNGSTVIRGGQSLPTSIIFGNRNIGNISTTQIIRPVVFDIGVMNNTTVTFTSKTPIREAKIKYDIGDEYTSVNLTNPVSKTYTKGHHRIEIVCGESVKLTGNNFKVVRITGEYPYNSEIDFENCEHYQLRELGRDVFAVCNHNTLHSKSFFKKYVPILHKDLFVYHDDVTSSKIFDQTNYNQKAMYSVPQSILQHMTSLTSVNNIIDGDIKVLSKRLLPYDIAGKAVDATLFGQTYNDPNKHHTHSRIHLIDGALDREYLSNINMGQAQIVSTDPNNRYGLPKEEYLEFYLEGFKGSLKITKLIDEPIFPITVETLSKSKSEPQKTIITSLDQSITISDNCYIRIYSQVAVWIDNKDAIKEVFGVIPKIDWTYKFIDMAPRLRRVGDLIFIRCTNRRFYQTFKGLADLEFVPGTIFWYNYDAIDYEECFADTPKLFTIEDYMITDKNTVNKINCRGMFKNSGVQNVRKPIADDIVSKVDITNMLLGCHTKHYYNSNIESEMFKNIDTVGVSGVVNDGSANHSDNETLYIPTNTPNLDGCQMAYFIDQSLIPSISSNNIRFCSQSISDQTIVYDRGKWNTGEFTKYLVHAYKEVLTTVELTNDINANMYKYMPYITNIGRIHYIENHNIPCRLFTRNHHIIDMNNIYENSVITTSNITDLLPEDTGVLSYINSGFKNSVITATRSHLIIPENTIREAKELFSGINIDINEGVFNNVKFNSLPNKSTLITNMFKDSLHQTSEIGVFRSFGTKLNPILNTGVYQNNPMLVNVDSDIYSNCDLEVLDYHFTDTPLLENLPTINNMRKVYSYQHMFERSGVKSIPTNYIYTTRNDREIMMDYMFADCPNLFLSGMIVDSRSPGRFSIDYSLNNVVCSIGDDPQIFGNIIYDDTYEHRSRVIPLDDKVTWIQNIRTKSANITATIRSIQVNDLVGEIMTEIATILWGDDSEPVIIPPGNQLTADHVTHVYKVAGDYTVTIMMKTCTVYVDTTENSRIATIDLPTSFKFGSIDEVKTKGLSNMFGNEVESISATLFEKLDGVDTIEYYPNMFQGFNRLTSVPVGILDVMPNLKSIEGMLMNTKSEGVTTRLPSGLIDKLTKLTNAKDIARNSNVDTIEEDFFTPDHVGITSIENMLSGSKVRSIPATLLSPLTKLTNASKFLYKAKDFILDESYQDMFKTNTELSLLTQAFTGVKINGLGSNFINRNTKLTNIDAMLSSDDMIELPWMSTSSHNIIDDNDWVIPTGFMDNLSRLVSAKGLVLGRKSCKSYPIGLLDDTKNSLTNSSYMLSNTGVSKIHQGTITGKAINMDCSYMFYNVISRNCPKPITNSTSTFKTTGMLNGSSGKPTEQEIFQGVKTDPSTINSMYRQEFEWFMMDINIDLAENMFLSALEPQTFPWRNYVIDIQWDDGSLITIMDDVLSQDDLKSKTLHRLAPGTHTVKVKSPFAIELKNNNGNTVEYSRLYGSIGKMNTTNHIHFASTGFGKSVECIIDGDTFYSYNSHLTSLEDAFSNTKISAIKDNTFDILHNLTSIRRMCYQNTSFTIRDGYKPLFPNSPLKVIDSAFEGCSSFTPNKNYEPFRDRSTIASAVNVFARSGIITTPRVNTTSLTNAQGMYWTCDGLTTTYADILDGANKCSNFYGVFGHTPKLTNIEGESDTKSIFTSIVPSVSDIDFHQAFINSGLSRQQLIRIVNNMGVWKVTNSININCNSMFESTDVSFTDEGSLDLRINTTNKSINATKMFYDCRINNITNNAVVISGSGRLTYTNMFYNCFTKPGVYHLNDVFKIVGDTENTDYRPSELDTLNVFDINLTHSGDSVFNLKYVGAPAISTARYIELRIGDNIQKWYGDNLNSILSKDFTIPSNVNRLSIYSVPLILPLTKTNPYTVTSVTGHLSTHRDNYVNWSDKFNFGTYFADATTFDVKLGGQFYVLDGEFHTLNGIFKGMRNITTYSRTLFREYVNGTDGYKPIVGLIETFADNTSLNDIDPGMLQYIPYVESIRRTWYNTGLEEIREGVFASSNNIRDAYQAFGNTKVSKLPSTLIAIG